MGCAPSRPSRPPPQPQMHHAKPRTQNNARLSRPFDPNVPLYMSQPYSRKTMETTKPFDTGRHGDAFAQLNARSKKPQMPRMKAQVVYSPRIKSQTARKGYKGDTLYFHNWWAHVVVVGFVLCELMSPRSWVWILYCVLGFLERSSHLISNVVPLVFSLSNRASL